MSILNLQNCPTCESNQFSKLIQTKAQMHPSKSSFQFEQCENCKLVFLNPRLPLDQLKGYYSDYYLPYRGPEAWGKYEKQVVSSQQKIDQKRAGLMQEYHSVKSSTMILDVGCGKPTFLKTCAEKYHCQTIGIDFSDEGWKANPSEYQGIDLMVGEVKDLPADLRPDIITMWHYLEHDYDPLETLKILKSIAKPQTTLIIEVPNYDSESRKKFGEHWAGFHTPRHTFLFTPETINLALTKSGWKVKNINTFGTLDPYVLYWMSRMEQKRIDWSKCMDSEFFNYVRGMIKFLPKRIRSSKRSLGIMTSVASPV